MKYSLGLSFILLTAGCTGRSQPEHGGDVILITVDALRADFISPELTPTIHRLSVEGLSFANARANSSHPLQSSATLLTGLLPTRGGSIGLLEAAPSEEAETLAEAFVKGGYSTSLVSSQALLSAEGFRRGYADIQIARPGEFWGASDVAERAVEALEDVGNERCFMQVHFSDPHEPHLGTEPPAVNFAELRARIAGGADANNVCTALELESLHAAYRAEIAAVDAAVSLLIEGIAERAKPEGALIVFTSTCGEEFLEHGYVGHSWALHEESIRVPLFFHAAGSVTPAVNEQAVSLVDIAPTLFSIAALSERSTGFDGDILLRSGEATSLGPREVLAELVIRERCIMRAVIKDDAKLITSSLWKEPSERAAASASYMETLRAAAAGELELPPLFGEPVIERLYDLKHDPIEKTPLGGMSRVSTSTLRAVLNDYREYCAAHGLTPAAAKAAPSFSDSSEADALEALGYL